MFKDYKLILNARKIFSQTYFKNYRLYIVNDKGIMKLNYTIAFSLFKFIFYHDFKSTPSE